MSSTANRVIKNTGFLYAKMGITMFISLYTTRLILNSLGASDFGIFNIVGGAIAMLGFLNGAMASATQRFMSYTEGEGDKEKQKNIFNISLILHFIISLIVGVALIIAGYFFFNGILNIPSDRVFAAKVVYGSLIVSTVFTVMTVPYDAVMNAHENMKYYAIVGIIESLLKLAVAFACVYSVYDKLIVYGILMACIPLVTLTIMRVYCHKHYTECLFAPKRYWDKGLMKEMTRFAGWNFTSSMASMITLQGTSIVLNYFFGVLANAAQGIANQLSGQIMVFSNAMLKALNPVITKNEGAHDRDNVLKLALSGNKLSFFILSVFTIPFVIEMPYILKIWLKTPPEYAVIFCRLIFIRQIISQLSVTFCTCINASGQIKNMTIWSSVIWISLLPVSIFVYWIDGPIYSIYILFILLVIARDSNTIFYMHKICNLNVIYFLRSVVFPCILTVCITTSAGYISFLFFKEGFGRLLLTCFITISFFPLCFYSICLNKQEKELIYKMAKSLYSKFKQKYD